MRSSCVGDCPEAVRMIDHTAVKVIKETHSSRKELPISTRKVVLPEKMGKRVIVFPLPPARTNWAAQTAAQNAEQECHLLMAGVGAYLNILLVGVALIEERLRLFSPRNGYICIR